LVQYISILYLFIVFIIEEIPLPIALCVRYVMSHVQSTDVDCQGEQLVLSIINIQSVVLTKPIQYLLTECMGDLLSHVYILCIFNFTADLGH
jgi:hypothetical protein